MRVSHIDGHATAFLFLSPGALWSSQISLNFKIKRQDNMDHFGTCTRSSGVKQCVLVSFCCIRNNLIYRINNVNNGKNIEQRAITSEGIL